LTLVNFAAHANFPHAREYPCTSEFPRAGEFPARANFPHWRIDGPCQIDRGELIIGKPVAGEWVTTQLVTGSPTWACPLTDTAGLEVITHELISPSITTGLPTARFAPV
jgi:hypothetical protein